VKRRHPEEISFSECPKCLGACSYTKAGLQRCLECGHVFERVDKDTIILEYAYNTGFNEPEIYQKEVHLSSPKTTLYWVVDKTCKDVFTGVILSEDLPMMEFEPTMFPAVPKEGIADIIRSAV
jgi:hypothetical protein